MQEIFDPLASTITLTFHLNNREDNDCYQTIKGLLRIDSQKDEPIELGIEGNNLSKSSESSPFSLVKVTLEKHLPTNNPQGDDRTRAHELEELREKVEQLELENFHLIGSANNLRSQILATRYEV